MAVKIQFIHASTLSGLEYAVNEVLAQEVDDARIVVELVGGVSFAVDQYIVAVCTNAPHKRRFAEGDDARRQSRPDDVT